MCIGFMVYGCRFSGYGVEGLRCGVWVCGLGSGFGGLGLGFGVRGLRYGCRVWGLGSKCRVTSFWFSVLVFGSLVSGFGFRVSDFGFRVSGQGLRVLRVGSDLVNKLDPSTFVRQRRIGVGAIFAIGALDLSSLLRRPRHKSSDKEKLTQHAPLRRCATANSGRPTYRGTSLIRKTLPQLQGVT